MTSHHLSAVLLLVAFAAGAAPPRRDKKVTPPAEVEPAPAVEPAQDSTLEALRDRGRPPALGTPQRDSLVAPPLPPVIEQPVVFPSLRISPSVRFSLAADPGVLDGVSTTFARGGVDVGALLHLGRLQLELHLGGHTIKEFDTPIAIAPGPGGDAAVSFDPVRIGNFVVRVGGRVSYARSSGTFLGPEYTGSASQFQFRYSWFDAEAIAGAAYVRGGVDLSLGASARYVTGSLEAPAPIGNERITVGGLRSSQQIAGAPIGVGLRGAASWHFRFTPGSSWGGLVSAKGSLFPHGGSLAMGAWF